ncbi:hypothetical protein TBLA_0H02380 [Henningerozyma blattae CBS 6284]|uniref:Elongator complex protein 2 n=1 Tax=Henningerozyma blattae (strain ATCC 34711 / CBS 6284 / DSM 70876 / NBRC 10599 / NRRL Y-10934 / UCD 77-7) TaxID=1071380 RepID=I2H821_HENB6|nr:hypothetical protein TBLA_0H02380 [Tetrapisispora blattae CBS 6284]CCH62523.1 hypothetical protein TBLA_0H02380 [Tetrapisispora blattae CBS 6284]
MPKLTPVATFIGANKQTQVSDFCSSQNLVAFGASNTIALWNPLDPSYKGVYATLKGHQADVTCVRLIPDSNFMVSTSEDHHVKLWKFSQNDKTWDCVQSLTKYTSTIVSLAVLKNLIVIGCADGNVSIWVLNEDNEEEYLKLGNEFIVQKGFFPLSMTLSNIIDDKYLLAIGGSSINIFVYSFILPKDLSTVQECIKVATLEGHEDWVKALSFRYQETPGDYLLASGSQDRYIRLWRIRINDLIDNSDEDETKLNLLNNKQYKFQIGTDLKVAINFEALIMGHDDWISSLQWHSKKLQLLASTADTAVMVWEPDEVSGIWVCGLRLGEMSSKGASTATGSSGGFWTCLWFECDGKEYILTNGKTGSWRIWSSTDNLTWEPEIAISGATKEVTDVAWSPNGGYLLSTSLDQTTRLFAPWTNSDKKSNSVSWHEMSRPQIHGYDMICVEPVNDSRFVSGGDEKILRSFDMPKGVSELLNKFSNIQFNDSKEMPMSAALPALGLSNKANMEDNLVNDAEDEDNDERENDQTHNISYDLVSSLNSPPFEDQLQRHLLWPEIEKLYGHGYEIVCVDVSPDKKLIASACRSNTQQHAVIRIFNIDTWLEIKPPLSFHTLTITKLRFSKDSKYLLSVCRDRQWAIWERKFEDNSFTLKYSHSKPHTRIIWDCDWAPLEFDKLFITASRDKTIKSWKFMEDKDEQNYKLLHSIKHTQPVTAVSIYNKVVASGGIIVAIGLEDGNIIIYDYDNENGFKLLENVESRITPGGKITRLRWSSKELDNKLYLGVSSSDTSTRIYEFF